jgi:hypothetical protein
LLRIEGPITTPRTSSISSGIALIIRVRRALEVVRHLEQNKKVDLVVPNRPRKHIVHLVRLVHPKARAKHRGTEDSEHRPDRKKFNLTVAIAAIDRQILRLRMCKHVIRPGDALIALNRQW